MVFDYILIFGRMLGSCLQGVLSFLKVVLVVSGGCLEGVWKGSEGRIEGKY